MTASRRRPSRRGAPGLLAAPLVLGLVPRPAEAVVYGTDDRTEALAHPSAAWQDRARLSIMSVARDELAICDGATVELPTALMGEVRELCEDQPFYEQPVISYCSSTLIDDDVVATAAHCMFDEDTGEDLCPRRAFVAGLHLGADGTPPWPGVEDVYGCRQVLVHVPGIDIALVQLERPVTGDHEPAPVSPVEVALADAVGVIGFPDGIPMKVTEGCSVLSLTESLIGNNCDIFRGNSGSGLFRADTLELVGVIASGPNDYRLEGDCRVVNQLTEDGQLPGVPSAPQLANAYPIGLALAALCDLGFPGPLCGTEAACGDGWCSGGETASRCAADCQPVACGDGVCAVLEELECTEDCGHLTERCEEPGGSGTGDSGDTDESGDAGLDDTGTGTGGSTGGSAGATSGGVDDGAATVADESTGGEPAAEGDGNGCGCRARGGSSGAWWLGGGVVLGVWRRRRARA